MDEFEKGPPSSYTKGVVVGNYITVGFAFLMLMACLGYFVNKETAYLVHIFLLVMWGTVQCISAGLMAAGQLVMLRYAESLRSKLKKTSRDEDE